MCLQLLQFVLGWLTFYHEGEFGVYLFYTFVAFYTCYLYVFVYCIDLIFLNCLHICCLQLCLCHFIIHLIEKTCCVQRV